MTGGVGQAIGGQTGQQLVNTGNVVNGTVNMAAGGDMTGALAAGTMGAG